MDPILEEITPQDLFEFARAVPVPENFLLTRSIVPFRKIQGIRWQSRSRTRTRSAAKFRAWDTETPRGPRRVSRLATEGELPPLGIKFEIGEREQILLDAVRNGDDALLINELYDDAEAGVIGIYTRWEVAAGDMLADGVFTLDNENGITDEVDWDVPTDNLPTAANFWDDPALSTPIEDEQDWIQRLFVAKGKGRPGKALSSARVASFLGSTQQYRNEFFGTSGVATHRNLDPGEVAGVRARKRLPEIVEYDEMVDVDGASVRPLPDNLFILLPADSSRFAETQIGLTAEVNTLVSGGQLTIEREDEPGIITTKKVGDDPISVTTRSNATGMPVMYDPEGYVSATVLDELP